MSAKKSSEITTDHAGYHEAAALWRRAATCRCTRTEYFEPLVAGVLRHGTSFERIARGLEPLESTDVPTILLTGFDPFGRPGEPLPEDAWNPSAVVASLHAETERGLRLESAIVPVSYDWFDTGAIERLVNDRLPNLVGIISVSMGRRGVDEPCRLERFVTGVRLLGDLHLHSELPIERHRPSRVQVPSTTNFCGAPVYESRLDLSAPQGFTVGDQIEVGGDDDARMLTCEESAAWVGSEWTDGTMMARGLDQVALRSGPGGWFLSNEISYRIHRELDRLGSSIPSVHVHTPNGGSCVERDVVDELSDRLRGDLRRLIRSCTWGSQA
ncbi:MAG: pyrrolidone-carboxylate peptidase [Myxococcota bacterium]|jgi:pyrrolidone-carboxylate peptidase